MGAPGDGWLHTESYRTGKLTATILSRGGCHMRLLRSFARELARPVGVSLAVFATWALLDGTVLTQAPAPAPPAGTTAPPQAPPAGGGRAGDPAPAAGG